MQNKLTSLFALLLAATAGGIVMTLLELNPWLIIACLVTTASISIMMLRQWVSSVHLLHIRSRTTLNKTLAERYPWFPDLAPVAANLELLESRLAGTAGLIANLTHPEKADLNGLFDAHDPIVIALDGIKTEMARIRTSDAKREWIAQGLASFGEILRDKKEIREYGDGIIRSLVKYMKVNQGGLYIEYVDQQQERYLELTACYAYGRKKFLENKITPGEGLLGQVMLEKSFVFLTDVPSDYLAITSGLGEATPGNIVLAPLIFNEIFCGVIELASFEILDSHQLEFLKKVCEDIASEIVSFKNVENIKNLLEASNKLTLDLQAREEEMQQNLRDLASAQEEMSGKQTELSGMIDAIDSTLATAELDISGGILKHNAILNEFLRYEGEELIGKDYSVITGSAGDDELWNRILNGTLKAGDFITTASDDQSIWLSITFNPIRHHNGTVERILLMIQNVTEKKLREKEFERLSLVADNTDNAVIIADTNGLVEYVNDGFVKMTGYSLKDIIGKKPGHLLQGEESNPETIQRIREKIKRREPVYEEILNYNKQKERYWVSVAINPVFDAKGELSNFISVQANITETKKRSLDYSYKLDAISRSNTIIEFDTSGIILDANQNFLDMMGYRLEEILGKHHNLFVSGREAGSAEYKTMWEKLALGEYVSDEYARITKSGKVIWLRSIYNPILDMNGRTMKIIKFAVDISEEKRLQGETAKKQKELNGYLEGINNTIASAAFDSAGNFIEANEIFLKVMGYTPEDLRGRNFNYMMGSDHSVDMIWSNLCLGKFFSGEFKMRNSTGKEFWLNGTFNPIKINNDSPEKILMFAQFTTQEKEKLGDLNTMVQALKSTFPVLEFNHDFSCKAANEKSMKIFGLNRLGLKSKSIADFIDPAYHDIWERQSGEILSMGFSSLTLPFVVKEHVIPYEVSLSIVRNHEGAIIKVIMIMVKDVKDIVPSLIHG